MKSASPLLLAGLLVGFAACVWMPSALAKTPTPSTPPTPTPVSAADPPLLMAHYLTWFEADPAGSRWGWHWTMDHYHPEHRTNGRREAASHDYPLIGLYDSHDPDVLECHVLLMKFAGIGGVFIDWAGTDDFLDYGRNHRNALQLIPFLHKAGLKFAIVYEDAAVPKMIAAGRFPPTQAVAHGQALMQWMQANWFTDPAYLKQDRRPVLLDFGAGYYQSGQWDQIFSALPMPPAFFTESDRRAPAVGGFDWPQPGGGTQRSLQETEQFEARARAWPRFIPAAFPRFHDIYAEAGVQNSWGRIEDRDGKTYQQTLERAAAGGAPVIQLVTWNDWGEGTQIEPSVEVGYRDLEMTQRLCRRFARAPFRYTASDLRLPVELYTLRKTLPASPITQAGLNHISDLLFWGHLAEARQQIAALTRRLPQKQSY